MARPTKYTHEHDSEIARKYQEDKVSLRSLSREYEIPVMTIKRRLIKMGVEIRNISTAMTLHHLRRKDADNAAEAAKASNGGLQRANGVVNFDDDPVFTNDEDENDEWIS